MSLHGSCACNNIQFIWHCDNSRLTPRACQCSYCLAHNAAYVTQAGSPVAIHINNQLFHATHQHGSHSAVFHECTKCQQVVFVSADIEGEIYAALNSQCLHQQNQLLAPVKRNFSQQSAKQKKQRWQQNWCKPTTITINNTALPNP